MERTWRFSQVYQSHPFSPVACIAQQPGRLLVCSWRRIYVQSSTHKPCILQALASTSVIRWSQTFCHLHLTCLVASLQEDLAREVQNGAAAKVFDLHLPHLGPYSLDFTRNGRHMLIAGRKGHLAIVDWQRAHIITELQVRSQGLHGHSAFASEQCTMSHSKGLEGFS